MSDVGGGGDGTVAEEVKEEEEKDRCYPQRGRAQKAGRLAIPAESNHVSLGRSPHQPGLAVELGGGKSMTELLDEDPGARPDMEPVQAFHYGAFWAFSRATNVPSPFSVGARRSLKKMPTRDDNFANTVAVSSCVVPSLEEEFVVVK